MQHALLRNSWAWSQDSCRVSKNSRSGRFSAPNPGPFIGNIFGPSATWSGSIRRCLGSSLTAKNRRPLHLLLSGNLYWQGGRGCEAPVDWRGRGGQRPLQDHQRSRPQTGSISSSRGVCVVRGRAQVPSLRPPLCLGHRQDGDGVDG
jgi:hypothetical protein